MCFESEIMLAACRVFNTSLFGANWHLWSFQKMHVSPLLLFSVFKNCNNVTPLKTKEILVSLAKLLKCLSPHHRNVIYCLSRFVETDYDRPLYDFFFILKRHILSAQFWRGTFGKMWYQNSFLKFRYTTKKFQLICMWEFYALIVVIILRVLWTRLVFILKCILE